MEIKERVSVSFGCYLVKFSFSRKKNKIKIVHERDDGYKYRVYDSVDRFLERLNRFGFPEEDRLRVNNWYNVILLKWNGKFENGMTIDDYKGEDPYMLVSDEAIKEAELQYPYLDSFGRKLID